MQRVFEQRFARRVFHDLAQVHHGDLVAEVLHHAEVVRDEEVGQAELLLQRAQQVEDLRLDGDIERRDRLVADHQLGLGRERPRDADTLALPAGELVGEQVHLVGAQADLLEERAAAFAALVFRSDVHALHRFSHDGAGPHPRVERGIGVLKDHLHLVARAAQRLALQRGEGLAGEADLARREFDQPHDRERRGGLARAGFADDAEGAAARDREAHAVDRAHRLRRGKHRLLAQREVHLQVVDFEQQLAHAASPVFDSSQQEATCDAPACVSGG